MQSVQNKIKETNLMRYGIEILPPEVIERNGYHVENCGYLMVKND